MKPKFFLLPAVLVAVLCLMPGARTQSIQSSNAGDIDYAPSAWNYGSSFYIDLIPSSGNSGFGVGNDNFISYAYAAFNISSLTAPVASASMTIYTGANNQSKAPTNLYFYSYNSTTPTATAASFNSMVAGTVIGTGTLPSIPLSNPTALDGQYLTYDLNSAGLAALNVDIASDTPFQVTADTDLYANTSQSQGEYFMFGSTITLNVTPTPEPSSWMLGLICVGCFAFLRTRRLHA